MLIWVHAYYCKLNRWLGPSGLNCSHCRSKLGGKTRKEKCSCPVFVWCQRSNNSKIKPANPCKSPEEDLHVHCMVFLIEKWFLQNIQVKTWWFWRKWWCVPVVGQAKVLSSWDVYRGNTRRSCNTPAAGGGWEPKALVSVFVTVTSSHQSLHCSFILPFFQASARECICLFSSSIIMLKYVIKKMNL